MTPVEKMGGLLDRLPWASSLGGAVDHEEDVELEQAELDSAGSLRVVPLPSDDLDRVFRLLSLPYSPSDVLMDLQQGPHRGLWEGDKQERAMARLEGAAMAKDERAFVEALKGVEWHNRPSVDFIRTAGLALKAGAYAAAYQISAEGAKYHPDNPKIQKYVHVLAPARAVSGKAATDSGHKANRDWLRAHGSEYSGQWVAVRDGNLLGVAGSLRELADLVGDTRGALLTKAL